MKLRLIRGIFQDGKVIPRGKVIEVDEVLGNTYIKEYKAEIIEELEEKKEVVKKENKTVKKVRNQ